ncbi:hypothetical protein SNEBB_002665 [Seison nebaliae]|nr:hypothetical protein SNEBB_002665 [Seison nebaliae]
MFEKKYRLLIFTESFHPYTSGICRRFKEIIRHMDPHLYDIHIVTGCRDANDYIVNEQLTHVTLSIVKSIEFEDRIDCMLPFIIPQWKLLSIIKDFGPDCIHVVEHTPGAILTAIFGYYLNIPIIWSHHTSLDTYIPSFIPTKILSNLILFLYRKLRAHFLQLANVNLTVSRNFADQLESTGCTSLLFDKTDIDKLMERITSKRQKLDKMTNYEIRLNEEDETIEDHELQSEMILNKLSDFGAREPSEFYDELMYLFGERVTIQQNFDEPLDVNGSNKHLFDRIIIDGGRVGVWKTGVNTQSFRPNLSNKAMKERLMDSSVRDKKNDEKKDENILLLSVGRLSPEKNFEFLAKLMPLLPSNYHLSIIGDGPYKSKLEPLFDNERTKFIGFLHGKELYEAYSSADVFVYASETETFGQVYLEAMASALPIASVDGPQIKEYFVPGESGYLWQSNDIEGAVTAILTTVKNRKRIRSTINHVPSQYTWEAASKQITFLYSFLIEWNRHLKFRRNIASLLTRIISFIFLLFLLLCIVIPSATARSPTQEKNRESQNISRYLRSLLSLLLILIILPYRLIKCLLAQLFRIYWLMRRRKNEMYNNLNNNTNNNIPMNMHQNNKKLNMLTRIDQFFSDLFDRERTKLTESIKKHHFILITFVISMICLMLIYYFYL